LPAEPQPLDAADSSAGPFDLRQALLAAYHEGQGATASPAVYADIRAQWPYYEANYRHLLDPLHRTANVLEVGGGHGSLLAWLRSLGFEHLEGVDASPGEVEFANAHLGAGTVVEADVLVHLEQRSNQYDLIVAKAIVEHIPKPSLLELVHRVHAALRPGGIAIVDVPNMDWIAAIHERYMDLTHEIGFTKQSLRSLLQLRFEDVEIRGSRLALPTRSQRLLRGFLVGATRRLLYVIGEGADDVLFESRSLVGIARKIGSS
jgi:SAM-dependent methyltransferase